LFAGGVDHLLTIGAFAQRCGLSRSALRFYDECGLLLPVAVDDSTGYRYYAAAQVADAVLVKRLRCAEVPVGEVRQFLGAGAAERRQMLAAHAGRLEDRAGALRRALDELAEGLEQAAQGEQLASCTLSAAAVLDAISQVSFAASRGGHRPELSGVWVEAAEGSLRMVATDSYRLAVRDLPLGEQYETSELVGFLPLATAGELCAALAGASTVKLSRRRSGDLEMAIDDDAVVTTVAYEGRFPDYGAVLAGNVGGHRAVAGVRALANALLGAAEETATLDFTPGALVVRSGGAQVVVEGSWDGPALSMVLNPGFVSEALGVMVGPDVVVEASGALRPLVLRSADTGTLTVLTMPVRPRP
jgi:DNA-binding transcriptional MerR regulator